MKLPTHARIAAAALLCIGLPQLAQASTVYGSLSNFDVFNDSGSTSYYGFEIELEGLSASSVPYTYSSWNYGPGQVVQSGANAIVRYSKPNAVTVPYTGTPVSGGHNCIQITGCEHFGVSLTGTATATRYYWLDQSGARSTQVSNLLTPVMTVVLPAAPPQNGNPPQPAIVRAEVKAPEPEQVNLGFERSDAVWVQVFKTEVSKKAQLDDLMADNPVIADEDNHIDLPQTEMEWKLFQRNYKKDANDPENLLDSGDQAVGNGMEQVLRTYRFYAFAGTYLDDDGSHEAICTDVGNCEDLAANGTDHLPYVGKLIGQQMVALNLDGVLPPAPVPVPASAWLLGSGLFGLTALARRQSKGA